MYERGIILRISPVQVYSQANSFQARVENRHYKEKNCDIYQELKDDFLVYERRELYHDNVRLTIVKEFTDDGQLKTIYEEKITTFEV